MSASTTPLSSGSFDASGDRNPVAVPSPTMGWCSPECVMFHGLIGSAFRAWDGESHAAATVDAAPLSTVRREKPFLIVLTASTNVSVLGALVGSLGDRVQLFLHPLPHRLERR